MVKMPGTPRVGKVCQAIGLARLAGSTPATVYIVSSSGQRCFGTLPGCHFFKGFDMMKVMVCGVDCHRADANCNGYCTGKAENPPAATPEQVLASARRIAHEKLREAEVAWHEYFGLCEVGPDRTWASEVYERVRVATRRT